MVPTIHRVGEGILLPQPRGTTPLEDLLMIVLPSTSTPTMDQHNQQTLLSSTVTIIRISTTTLKIPAQQVQLQLN